MTKKQGCHRAIRNESVQELIQGSHGLIATSNWEFDSCLSSIRKPSSAMMAHHGFILSVWQKWILPSPGRHGRAFSHAFRILSLLKTLENALHKLSLSRRTSTLRNWKSSSCRRESARTEWLERPLHRKSRWISPSSYGQIYVDWKIKIEINESTNTVVRQHVTWRRKPACSKRTIRIDIQASGSASWAQVSLFSFSPE
jgi:hypothetical protein